MAILYFHYQNNDNKFSERAEFFQRNKIAFFTIKTEKKIDNKMQKQKNLTKNRVSITCKEGQP